MIVQMRITERLRRRGRQFWGSFAITQEAVGLDRWYNAWRPADT